MNDLCSSRAENSTSSRSNIRRSRACRARRSRSPACPRSIEHLRCDCHAQEVELGIERCHQWSLMCANKRAVLVLMCTRTRSCDHGTSQETYTGPGIRGLWHGCPRQCHGSGHWNSAGPCCLLVNRKLDWSTPSLSPSTEALTGGEADQSSAGSASARQRSGPSSRCAVGMITVCVRLDQPCGGELS